MAHPRRHTRSEAPTGLAWLTSINPWPSIAGRIGLADVGKVGRADPWIAALAVALMVFGVVMVYSSSAVFANKHFGSGQHFLFRQGAFVLCGLAMLFVLSRVNYHHYARWTYLIFGVSVVMLLIVASGLGRVVGGAARWIPLGPVNIQPSEVAKLALVMWLAYSLSKKGVRIRTFSIGFLPHALVAGFLMLLCLLQPDFGGAAMLGLLTLSMLFLAGARTGYLLMGLLIAAPVAWALIASSPYRVRRIQAFLQPFEHRDDVGYQITESLIAFGSGGTWGVGIGDSRQKLFFLPEAHTDFIGAIIGEELGFAGVVLLIIAFCVLLARGFRTALRAPDAYGSYLAAGITMFIGYQAFTNLAVAMGLLPTKGLVLPLISYGGSSLFVNCAAVGVLLNVSRERTPDSQRVSNSTGSLRAHATTNRNRTRPRQLAPEGGHS